MNSEPQNIIDSNVKQEVSQDSKNIVLLIWLGSIIFSFVPSLVFYLIKKEDAYIQEQAKEALNWSITSFFAYIICFILAFAFIGFILMLVLAVVHLVFCIMGAVAGSNGQAYRAAFNIRLIK
jgi:uncharacterized Tic20 family protein